MWRTLRTQVALTMVAVVGVGGLPLCAGVSFHVPVGISFTTGAFDVLDSIDDMYQAEWGVGLENKFVWPASVSVNPYMEFDFGLGIGLSAGPASLYLIEEDFYYGGGHDDDVVFNWTVPVGMDLRYTFFRDGTVSPYVRAGFRYPLVGGDYLENGEIGPFGAIGVELWRNKAVGLGFEAAYDGSEIDVVGRSFYRDTVKPNQFLFSVFAVF